MQSTISAQSHSLRRPSPFASELEQQPLRRTVFDFATIFGLLFVMLFVVGILIWQFSYINRIYGGVTIHNIAVGGMTRAQALTQLTQLRDPYPQPAVSLVNGQQQWPVTTETLRAAPDLLTAVNEAYLVGRQQNVLTRLGQQFVALLGGVQINPPFTYDRDQLRELVFAIADEARQPGRPARQMGEITVPAEPGTLVDVGATMNALLTTLESTDASTYIEVPLVVTEFMPEATTSTVLAPSSATKEILPITTPLRLYDERFALEFALDPALLQQIAAATNPLQFDETMLRQYLAGWAETLDVAPRDARLRFNPNTGGVTVIQESVPGRQLDIDATVASVREALATDVSQASLVMVEVAPAVDMNRIAEMGIRELVASGRSDFYGSSTARIHNIEVAAEKFDGLVIPPGEIFSFNEGVEDVTSANGFEDSLIIWGDTTAVGVGGGVCQVSTTIFRAAYSGGFPIVERYNHGYVVSWYGEPGLDATIYTPTVDFRFRNDTGAYLLVESVVNSVAGVITFNLYGTKPAREVTVSQPKRTDVIEPEPPNYVVNESLAPGERKQTEWEQKGMTVSVERTIIENGTTRTDTLTSVYQPWQAVYEVGPGTEIPATVTPAAVEGFLDPQVAITPTPSSPRAGP